MAISPTPTAVALLLISLLFLLASYATPISSDSIVSELSALQSQSPTGVIHLTDSLLRRIVSLPSPRPFYSLIFFNAHQFHSNNNKLRSSFMRLDPLNLQPKTVLWHHRRF
ncbi:hypothetical protein Salat_1077400 [Sesamum alatum]|uniref:Uncharacterized protein n=1 Tax=Sesamum alatum TaxID=300844 RepID=A0AAE1YN81_9LAMI|nr:hypothetical protein Salat_1077400 [Sesamum alatum]